jgi:hypothetical protein
MFMLGRAAEVVAEAEAPTPSPERVPCNVESAPVSVLVSLPTVGGDSRGQCRCVESTGAGTEARLYTGTERRE